MTPLQTRLLTRQQIGDFIGSPRGVRAFESAQSDVTNVYNTLSSASFLTLTDEPTLGGERHLFLTAGELVGADAGINATYTLGLADTTVAAGSYGDASHLVRVTVDAKGRLTGVLSYALNSDNVTEGSTNLFFTVARARASISASGNLSYNSTTGVMTLTLPGGTTTFLRADGSWATPPGGSGGGYTVSSSAVSYTETTTSGEIVVKMTASGQTITLPTAVGNTAKMTFKLMVAGTLTVAAAGAETIDGSATAVISTQYAALTMVSDNAGWLII